MIAKTQAVTSRMRMVPSANSDRIANHIPERLRSGLRAYRRGIATLKMTAGRINCIRGNAQAFVSLGLYRSRCTMIG